jgi:hypothetical protein
VRKLRACSGDAHGTFDQEKLSWRTNSVRIVLKKLCGDIYKSCLDIEYEPIAKEVCLELQRRAQI